LHRQGRQHSRAPAAVRMVAAGHTAVADRMAAAGAAAVTISRGGGWWAGRGPNRHHILPNNFSYLAQLQASKVSQLGDTVLSQR
jgi:hypothetical protein